MTRLWDFTDYTGESSPNKRRRLRHRDRVALMLQYLRQHDYVVVLGPAHSEKTRLLEDVAAAGERDGRFTAVKINLWQARTGNEAEFFQSLVSLICRSSQIEHCIEIDDLWLDGIARSRDFQRFLERCTAHQRGDIVLMFDHLQALPHDLIQLLLNALRATFMERNPEHTHFLDAVIAGGMALADLSLGLTSPFNFAQPIFQGHLTSEQTMALARENFTAYEMAVSSNALERIDHWAGGDRFLVPQLVADSIEAVKGYRRPQVTQTVIDQTARRICGRGSTNSPFREAIEVIEDDPDTVLDVLELLRQSELPRNRSHQSILRGGLDRLQLSGAVVLEGEHYRIKNAAYVEVLGTHFAPAQVGHVLRMNGRWKEAIDFLSDNLAAVHTARDRADLLEAIVESIYASDDLDVAYAGLLDGIRRGFGLANVGIYRARAGRGKLMLVQSDIEEEVPKEIDLNDLERVEVQTFRSGEFALRGAPEDRRLVARLVPERRPIGLVTIDHYSTEPQMHGMPPGLPDLLRFLRYAAGAIEDVTLRAAFREIGRAVLSASSLQSNLDRVLQIVVDAVGGELGVLYLLDDASMRLIYQCHAGVGAFRADETTSLILLADDSHPAVQALTQDKMRIRRSPSLRRYMQVFLPLSAANRRLGVLMIAFDNGHGVTLNGEERKTLTTFADQLSIAVHNTQLLQHTSDRLEAKIREEQELRRQIERMHSNELAEVATALVHRLGHAGDVPVQLEAARKAVSSLTAQLSGLSAASLHDQAGDGSAVLGEMVQKEIADEHTQVWRHLDHVEKRFRQIIDLLPALNNVGKLKEMTLEALDLRRVIEQALARFTCSDAISIHCPLPNVPVLVEGDASLLQEAINSLLENACEAMPAGGWLTIRLQREGDGFVTTYVSDSGAGVSEELRERIFEPGFSTRPAQGNQVRRGQGLFVGRAILRRHGGDILLHESGEQGATFAFRLPLLNADL